MQFDFHLCRNEIIKNSKDNLEEMNPIGGYNCY